MVTEIRVVMLKIYYLRLFGGSWSLGGMGAILGTLFSNMPPEKTLFCGEHLGIFS